MLRRTSILVPRPTLCDGRAVPDPPIHQFDPAMRPDADFEPGTPGHLVPGSEGRMLDPRRTPMRVEDLDEATGQFACRVLAFEDRGACWMLPFEDADCFQFPHGAPRADAATLARIEAAIARLDRPLSVACDPADRTRTQEQLAALRDEAAAWLEAASDWARTGATLDPGAREGDPRLWADLRAWLELRDLWDVEDAFATRYVSNPRSGEMVKGHRIVLAELGLVPFRGTVLRDPHTFSGRFARARRAEHLLARMAFVHAVFARAGLTHPLLYRGMALDGGTPPRDPPSFVSATFSRAVGESMFEPSAVAGGAVAPGAEPAGVLMRQRTPAGRLLMTYFETEPLNRQFKEAEAVLLAEPRGPLF